LRGKSFLIKKLVQKGESMASILESLMSALGPQVVEPLASRLGASSDMVQRGLQSGAASMLGGIAAKADQPGFMGQIFSLITNPANSSGSLSSLASNLSSTATGGTSSTIMDLGSRFLSSIFGSNLSAVSDAVGRTSGLPSSKASSLLTMAAPLVLGFLGQHVRESGLNAADLGSKLKAEGPSLQRFLPAGFSSMLGSASHLEAVVPAGAAAAAAATGTAKRWLWPLIALAAIILAGIWFFNRPKAPMPEEGEAPAASTGTLPAGYFNLKLPDGVELNVPESGIEMQLATFIADSSKPADTTTWFNFDRLVFDTGKATLQPTSREQLGNVAAILKAYPNVHAKIGGYTDNTGNAEANRTLSTDRARNVMDGLVAAGVDASRLESEGYGDEHPVADNSTEEGRAQNRRIALRVTAK
jgi:outer membrane protein OmpA-like peptidoglycan-associated protein